MLVAMLFIPKENTDHHGEDDSPMTPGGSSTARHIAQMHPSTNTEMVAGDCSYEHFDNASADASVSLLHPLNLTDCNRGHFNNASTNASIKLSAVLQPRHTVEQLRRDLPETHHRPLLSPYRR